MDSSAPKAAPGRGSELAVENITHRYGALTVLDNVSTRIAGGEFLRCWRQRLGQDHTTAHYRRPDRAGRGRIRVAGRDITGLPPERRDIGFVFQNYALFPI